MAEETTAENLSSRLTGRAILEDTRVTTLIENPTLITPYGGELVDLVVPREEADDLKARASGLPSIQLSDRAACDLELLATGAFSPLDRFMGERDYRRTVGEMRLDDGTVFPIPVTLPVDDPSPIRLDADIALRDSRNELLAVMTVQEAYEWDLDEAADQVFGTQDVRHPLVSEMHRWGRVNISGPLQVLQLPPHHDFTGLRKTPAETRASLAEFGHANVVAFQTRNPLHRAHEELTKRAAASVDGTLCFIRWWGSPSPVTWTTTRVSAPTRRSPRTITRATGSSCHCCRWR